MTNKNPAVPSAPKAGQSSPLVDWLAAILLLVAGLTSYVNSFSVPFVFDDEHAIEKNETIRRLWPIAGALNPPLDGAGVTGRPLVNLTLAVNYALGAMDVRVYHATNLAMHLCATLALWGVLRRTFQLPILFSSYGATGKELSWIVSLVWSVHPLLSESVVCVVQRNEVLGGLFYLLILYCFIRSATETTASRLWQTLSFAACLLGMASKEIVATAPLLVLLHDRTFVAGTFRGAWQKRKWFYGALSSTWLLLAWLMWHNQQRAGTVGFGLGVSSWEYLLTQCRALIIYLKLSFWPHPLVVDYGMPVVEQVGEVWWQGLIIIVLLLATATALWRKPTVGFLGAWFFIILAPSSSFVPLITQTIAEHRMYLPLAAIITFTVAGLVSWHGRRALLLFLLLATVAGALTVQRNKVYQNKVRLWQSTVANVPHNIRAREALGESLVEAGRPVEAIRVYEETLSMDLNKHVRAYPASLHQLISALHGGLGTAYFEVGRREDAVRELKEACRLNVRNDTANFNLATILTRLGQPGEALPHFENVLKIRPHDVDTRMRYALALLLSYRVAEAAEQFAEVIRQDPGNTQAHNSHGEALIVLERYTEAQIAFRTALRLDPHNPLSIERLAQLEKLLSPASPKQ